jgi:capsular exopolysaccharide synthesis family protein
MSLVHDMLTEVEKKEQPLPWKTAPEKQGGLFVLGMPNEITSDFYDLREHIRILNLREHVQVLSIADSSVGEGSSTIATFLGFLLAGGLVASLEKTDRPVEGKEAPGHSRAGLCDIPETDKIFTSSFRNLHSQPATTADVFQNWRDDIDSRFARVDNSRCVLLVDADLHQPSIHRYFGLELENGLAEMIEEKSDWREMARPVRDSNLQVITAGRTQLNPVELLGSERFRDLVETWKTEFRYVIFNSPAVLNYVDSLSLATVVDGVVLVVRAGQTRWDSAQRAKYKLSTAQANLLGVTLNRRKMDIPNGLYKRLI